MKRKQHEPAPLATVFHTVGYIVTKAERPLTLINVTGGHKGGILVPGSPVAEFAKRRDAKRAIDRTTRVCNQLRGTLVDGWDRLQPLFHDGDYAVLPLGRQAAPATPEEAAKV